MRIPVGIATLLAYPLYVRRTLRGAGAAQAEETLQPLIFERRPERSRDPALSLCVIQLLVGLGAMVGGAHLFVEHLLAIAESLGVEAVVLALVLAPLATELPEKVNSFFWVRDGKDSLALGNISGAMVFQSTIPVGIGLLFTDWHLSTNAAISVGLGLAGGLLAYEMLHRRGRFELPAVVGWFGLYAAFIVDRGAERLRARAESFEDHVVVRFGRDLWEDLGDLAVGADDEGRPLHAHVLLAVHRLLDPGAVLLGDGVVGVGEQGEVEVEFAGELRHRLDLVGGDADHACARCLVLGAAIAHAAGLGRAAGGVGTRVEVEDDRLALELREPDLLAVLIGQGEAGRLSPASSIYSRSSRPGSWPSSSSSSSSSPCSSAVSETEPVEPGW